jgi:hypothetical protein
MECGVSRWHEQIGDPTLADGILDRSAIPRWRMASSTGSCKMPIVSRCGAKESAEIKRMRMTWRSEANSEPSLKRDLCLCIGNLRDRESSRPCP